MTRDAAEGLALVSALWCRYCAGETDSGTHIPPNDPNWDALQALARAAKADPKAWLTQRTIYGEVADDARFATAFADALTRLCRDGTAHVLAEYLRGGA